MGVLDKFIQEVQTAPEPTKEMVQMDLINNPKINKDLLKQKIVHNVEMTDEELMVLLNESYEDILMCIFELDDLQYLQFVTTPRFISNLTKIISSNIKTIQHQTKIHINKLVYDYITRHTKDANPADTEYMNTLMVNLAKIVNETHIRALIGVGVDINTADFLALARFSSINESVNIRRVNFIICTTLDKMYDVAGDNETERIKAEQLIVNIYTKLFDRVTTLFEATMFDVYNLEEPWVTDAISEMYSLTTSAVLDILDNMTSPNIRTVILSFVNDYMSTFGPRGYNPRISLRTLSADYSRIKFVVEGLINDEKICVP